MRAMGVERVFPVTLAGPPGNAVSPFRVGTVPCAGLRNARVCDASVTCPFLTPRRCALHDPAAVAL